MKYYLYQFSDNWPDEMNLRGFAILTEVEKDMAEAKIKKEFRKGGSLSFGTEDQDYDFLDDILETITWKEITITEYALIKNLFGLSYGETGPLIQNSGLDEECENCGCELETYEDELCTDCKAEEESEEQEREKYNEFADKISKFINSHFGIEEGATSFSEYSRFEWKPTPNTNLIITVSKFDEEEGEMKIYLNLGSKNIGYEVLEMDDISDSFEEIDSVIKKFIEKSKKY